MGRGKEWRVYVAAPRKKARERCWRLRVKRRGPNGKWVDAYQEATETEDRTLAEELARIHEATLNSGGRVATSGAPTLPVLMEARITDMERDPIKSQESVVAFRYARDKLATILGDVPATALDRAALLRAQDRLRGEIGPETVNTYLRRAAACWRWCEARGLIDKPWPRIKPLKKPPARKRPYTPGELDAVLGWAREYEGGRWLGLLSLMAEAGGRRVSEVCRIKGRDVDRDCLTVRVLQKGSRSLVLPVTPETMALLPERGPDEWVFRRKRQARSGGGWGHARRDSVLAVVRRAIRALGIPDGERLDVHSFRRSFATDSHRAGNPNDVTRRLTGHEHAEMLEHYQRETVDDDLREAQRRVLDYRASARARAVEAASPRPPLMFGEERDDVRVRNDGSPAMSGASSYARRDSNPKPLPPEGSALSN